MTPNTHSLEPFTDIDYHITQRPWLYVVLPLFGIQCTCTCRSRVLALDKRTELLQTFCMMYHWLQRSCVLGTWLRYWPFLNTCLLGKIKGQYLGLFVVEECKSQTSTSTCNVMHNAQWPWGFSWCGGEEIFFFLQFPETMSCQEWRVEFWNNCSDDWKTLFE